MLKRAGLDGNPGRVLLLISICALSCSAMKFFLLKTLTLLAMFTGGSPFASERPNFLLFFADDMGYADLGAYGSTEIKTPRIDQLAAEGIRFTNFYAQPICGPSRAALLTGAYPLRVAEPANRKHPNTVPHAEEWLLSELLQEAGYRTALIGKWHLAGEGEAPWDFAPPPLPPGRPGGKGPFKPSLMPNRQGFDEFFGTPMHNGISREVDNRRFIIELMRDHEVIESPADNNLLTSIYTTEAIRFLESVGDEPFFLMLSYNAPHTPLGVHPDFEGRSGAGRYADSVVELDWSVGEILDALEAQGLSDQTLVLFLSDNGPEIRAVLGDDVGSAGPFRDGKYSNWEGGVRVPSIWRWPGVIPSNVASDHVTSIMDLYPTFARVAGARLPDRVIDGHDILSLLKKEASADSPYGVYYYHMLSQLQAVRMDDWKLVLPRAKDSPYLRWLGRYMDTVAAPQLYNLASDPGETNDVASEHPDVVRKLMVQVRLARQDLGDINRIGEGARFFDDGPRRPDTYFPEATGFGEPPE